MRKKVLPCLVLILILSLVVPLSAGGIHLAPVGIEMCDNVYCDHDYDSFIECNMLQEHLIYDVAYVSFDNNHILVEPYAVPIRTIRYSILVNSDNNPTARINEAMGILNIVV